MSKPIHRRMIPETFVQLLFEYLDSRGVNAEEVLAHPWPVPQANGLGGFPIEHWIELLSIAANHLKDPLLGLKLGQSITPRHVGVLAYVIQASENLAAVIERLEHYQRLIYDVTPMVNATAQTMSIWSGTKNTACQDHWSMRPPSQRSSTFIGV